MREKFSSCAAFTCFETLNFPRRSLTNSKFCDTFRFVFLQLKREAKGTQQHEVVYPISEH